MAVDDESNQCVLEQNGSQHENRLWGVIGINKLHWDKNYLNGLQRESFSMKYDVR